MACERRFIEANKREETYWDSIRPVPLTELEATDYEVKDSIIETADPLESDFTIIPFLTKDLSF